MPVLKIKKNGVWVEVVPDAVAENTEALKELDRRIQDVTSNIQVQLDAKATKSTTLSGYGITDAYTKPEIDNALAQLDSNVPYIAANVEDDVLIISNGETNIAECVLLQDSATGTKYKLYITNGRLYVAESEG